MYFAQQEIIFRPCLTVVFISILIFLRISILTYLLLTALHTVGK